MTLFSYVVARDYGFAPNPFCGFCTLATCKPDIRKAAAIGDWIVGTGSVQQGRGDKLIFVMEVSETMTFDQYWADPRFQAKKANLRASKKMAFGDNIYRSKGAKWIQSDSHHSYADGTPNPENIARDTKANKVLVGERFAYWGSAAIEIPALLRNFHGIDIRKRGPGHRSNFPQEMVDAFTQWFSGLNVQGYLGKPADWPKSP